MTTSIIRAVWDFFFGKEGEEDEEMLLEADSESNLDGADDSSEDEP